MHPTAHYKDSDGNTTTLLPLKSEVKVKLGYEPVKMGLLWQRTYHVNLDAAYTFQNNTSITQKLDIVLQLPRGYLGKMSFTIGEGATARKSLATPRDNVLTESVELPPGQSVPVSFSYDCRGSDAWSYVFEDASRIRDFKLNVQTDFTNVNYPVSSPTRREAVDRGLALEWHYEDAISRSRHLRRDAFRAQCWAHRVANRVLVAAVARAVFWRGRAHEHPARHPPASG